MKTWIVLLATALATTAALPLAAQTQFPGDFPPDGPPPFFYGPPPFGPRGPGPGGPGGPMAPDLKLVEKFDKDGDKRLNADERKAAREFLQQERAEGRLRRGPGGGRGPGGAYGPPGGFGGPRENAAPVGPGPKVSPAQVAAYPEAPFYDPFHVRTLFLTFASPDWEQELSDFHHTDVEVPATLVVDGKSYPEVGVHFRGASSYMMVGEGRKRSLNLSVDFTREDQRVNGYRTINLLNAHEDPTFLRSVLYYQIAREYLPAPKANFVRLVINGESWGVYVNVQQFNKDFLKEWFGTTQGARWKVPGSPRGRGSLAYLGEDPAAYKGIYEIKSKDDPKAWARLVELCRVLSETPPEQLEAALAPLLDIDGALKFLALENALINNDGYWIRTSDYDIYLDDKGRFHLIPYDANETFARPGGPGFGRGPGGAFGRGRPAGSAGPREPAAGPGGVELDPLMAANDPSKPLLSKLLAVPALRARYLGHVREIAEKWLDWRKLGPVAGSYHKLIAAEVRADTRKLQSTEAFEQGLAGDSPAGAMPRGPGGGSISLKSFADQRRAYLLRVTTPARL